MYLILYKLQNGTNGIQFISEGKILLTGQKGEVWGALMLFVFGANYASPRGAA